MMANNAIKYKFSLYDRDDRTLVIFPEKPFWFVGDSSVRYFVMYYSGTIDSKQLHSILTEQYLYSTEDVEEMLQVFLDVFEQAELFDLESTSQTSEVRSTEQFFPLPVLTITRDCNLRCKHCYAGAGYESSNECKKELTTAQWIAVIDEAIDLVSSRGEDRFLLTGGEPFVRKDIFELIEYIKKKNFRPLINTNGLLIKEDDIDILLRNSAELMISLDGVTAETHEEIRGKQTFDKTLKTISLLRDAGLPVKLSFTVHKGNLHELPALFDLAEQFGVKELATNTLMVLSRAAENRLKRVPVARLNDDLAKISDISLTKSELVAGPDYANLGAYLFENIRLLYCGVGSASLCVDYDGSVYPCFNTMNNRFYLGNVLHESLREIWNHAPVLTELRELRINTMNPKCAECDVRFYCGGGCRGETFAITGDLYSPYPFCVDTKEAIIDMMFRFSPEAAVFKNKINYYHGLEMKYAHAH